MDRLAVIASESQRFAEALNRTDPHRRCPSCPDWDAADLLWHLTEVHFFWAGILERRIVDADDLPVVEQSKPARPEAIADLLRLRAQATAALIEQLAERSDAEPCWSWWPADQTVGFTRRMQTYEATMHRVDAEQTASLPVSPIAPDVAAGAVDHAVDVMWGWLPDAAAYRADAVIRFVAADTAQSWLVEVGTWNAVSSRTGETVTGPRATRAAAGEPTATVTAPVVDLALWTWNRGGAVQISGEPASVAALDAVVAHGMS
jgi:uncharacterized protein (TIGR03083 family)